MRITNKELKDILKRVEKSITIKGKNDSETEYHNIEINSSNETIEAIATNKDTNSQIVLDTGIESKDAGSIFLNKKDIAKIKKLKTDFDFDFTSHTLKSGKFNINLSNDNLESVEFSVLNVVENPIILSDKVRKNISHIVNVADKNNPKYELNGILIENVSNNLNIVATDTRRLAILSDTMDFADFSINPQKHALELVNWIDVNFMLLSDRHLIIKEKNITHYIGLHSGKFPEYKRIVPKEYNKTVNLASCQFENLLKECKIFSGDIQINGNSSIEIINDDNDIEATYSHCYDFKDINIAFAIKHASDAINGETVDFCFNEPNLPFTIDREGYKTVIMPIYR